MSVKSLSNTSSSELIETAYQTFAKTKYLEFHTNRQRSTLSLPVSRDAPLMIDSQLRKACLERVTSKVEHIGSHFFSSLDGKTCYVDQEEIDGFTKRTRKEFPDLKFTLLFAIVDTDTGVELMPSEVVPDGWATLKKEGFSVELKIRAFVAKLIPDASHSKKKKEESKT